MGAGYSVVTWSCPAEPKWPPAINCQGVGITEWLPHEVLFYRGRVMEQILHEGRFFWNGGLCNDFHLKLNFIGEMGFLEWLHMKSSFIRGPCGNHARHLLVAQTFLVTPYTCQNGNGIYKSDICNYGAVGYKFE